MRPVFLRSLLFLLPLAACGGDDGSSGDPDSGVDAPDGTTRERVGRIEVLEDHWVFTADAGGGESRSARVDARFYQGREPSFHREAARAGDCVLRTHEVASCTPACTTGLCVDTNVCEPWATYVSAGRLSLAGLTTPVQIDPRDNYYYIDDPVPADLFRDDAEVLATLAGATIPGMSIGSRGVPPITPDITGGKVTVPFPAAAPLVVRWTPATTPTTTGARVRLTLNANNRGHGMPFTAIIECDVADAAGEVSVPTALLDAFPDTQAWTICAGTDCPPSNLMRYRRAAEPVGDQEVELVVASSFTFGIEHLVE